MRFQTIFILASALAAGSISYAADKAADKATGHDRNEIREIGEPKSCVLRSNIRSTDVIDDQTIDFIMRNGDIYRNKLPSRCSGLGFEEAFSYRTSTNRLCNVDIIRVLDQTGGQLQTRGACGLGRFQKIEKIQKAETAN